jgi:hypothetical protein
MIRLVPSLAAVMLLAAAAQAQLPQPVVKSPPPPTITLQVLSTEASPQEDPTVQAALTRLRSKVSGDATFASRLEAAQTKGDLATVGSLLGATLQVPRNSIVYGGRSKVGVRDDGSRGLVRFASFDPDAWRNPWFLIFTVGGRVYCASTSAATCHDALHKMGYANTEQIW